MIQIRKMSGKGDSLVQCQTVQDVEDKLMDNMRRGWRVVGKTATGVQESIVQNKHIDSEQLLKTLEKNNTKYSELLMIPSITAG